MATRFISLLILILLGASYPTFAQPSDTTDVGSDTLSEEEEYFTVIQNGKVKDSLNVSEYYALWNTTSVNPYNINARSLRDTIALNLYGCPYRCWSMPLKGKLKVNSRFTMRNFKYHYGTDIDLNTGDTVRAVFDGVVRVVNYDAGGYGHYVVIRHYNGLETLYGHLSLPLVKVKKFIKAGEALGLGGSTGRSTGPHLHFETRFQGNPFNPEIIFTFDRNKIRSGDFRLYPRYFSYVNFSANKKVPGSYLKGGTVYHTVARGDTVASLSIRYGVPVGRICELNGIATSAALKPGSKIRVK